MLGRKNKREIGLPILKQTSYKVFLFTIFLFSCREKPTPEEPQKSQTQTTSPQQKNRKRMVVQQPPRDELEPAGLIALPENLLQTTEKKLDLNEAKAKDLAARLKNEIHARQEKSP